MAEKPNPKSHPGKGQPSSRKRAQVAVPRARLAQEGPAPARPGCDPGAGHWPPAPGLAAPSAPPGRSRAPATAHRTPTPAPAAPSAPPGRSRAPATAHRTPTPAPAAPSAPPGRSRALATARRLQVPSAQDTGGEPGTSTAARARAGDPGHGTEPAPRTVRVARLTEARLRQLGRMSSYERILEWLDGAFPSTAEVVVELDEELDGYWESQE